MRRISAILLLGAVITYSEFATEIAVAFLPQRQDGAWQNYYANAHPYLTLPLEKLTQLIPELKGLQPAADQQELPTILESTGQRVDEFFRNVADLTAHEEITEEKLNGQGAVTKRLQVEDNYLIIRRGTEMFGQVREYRMDAKGNPVYEIGLNQGFFDTADFALDHVYFSIPFQPESTFLLLGEQTIDSRDTYVVAFSQKPDDATITVTMERRKPFPLLVNMLVQGIAWIDKSNFQIIRLRTDLLVPRPEIGLDHLTTMVTFKEVELPVVPTPLWLPSSLQIDAQFGVSTTGNYDLTFHNEHRYSDYQAFRVSVKMAPDEARAAPPGYVQPAGIGDETYYSNTHPYLEKPLGELHERIPELKKLQPATDQRMLPSILEKTATNVDEFFSHIVDLIAREKITQQRLNGSGFVTASEQVRDSYLILRHGTDLGADIIEYRMDTQGNRMGQVGLAKGYFATSGFALDCNYFSSAFQPESQFRYLGDQRIGSRDTFVVAFAQRPGKATQYVTMTGRKGTRVYMLMQGIAWVDKSNFQIIRSRTDLLAPHPEVGLDQQTTDVTLSKVQLLDMASPFWLPRNVKVYLRFKIFDPDRHQSDELSYRNEHHYSDYRRYRVSTKIIVPQ
jgi:hypothetical protein